jgi:hypothetical protein
MIIIIDNLNVMYVNYLNLYYPFGCWSYNPIIRTHVSDCLTVAKVVKKNIRWEMLLATRFQRLTVTSPEWFGRS